MIDAEDGTRFGEFGIAPDFHEPFDRGGPLCAVDFEGLAAVEFEEGNAAVKVSSGLVRPPSETRRRPRARRRASCPAGRGDGMASEAMRPTKEDEREREPGEELDRVHASFLRMLAVRRMPKWTRRPSVTREHEMYGDEPAGVLDDLEDGALVALHERGLIEGLARVTQGLVHGDVDLTIDAAGGIHELDVAGEVASHFRVTNLSWRKSMSLSE